MLSNLPIEIVGKIFLYMRCPVAQLIKNEIEIYEEDHNWQYTKIYKMFYIKNILPFDSYYFDKIIDPYYYDSFMKEESIKELYRQCDEN